MPLHMKRFENIQDKVFLVTGGAAGVGAGLVRTLLLENARYVAFLDVADKEGTILETELLSKFSALRAKFIKCDISDEAQLGAAFKQVFDKYRSIDVVINNAAVLGTDDVDFKKIVDINFTGTISSTLKAIELMSVDKGGSGGTVVNVSSLLALKQTPHLPVYASTKLGVLQFSNSIGADLFYSKTGVRVLTVCLGPTDTAIIQKINILNFNKDCTPNITSRAPVRQKVKSAANGILEVLNISKTSTTWMIADDKPPLDISKNISDGFETMLQSINFN